MTVTQRIIHLDNFKISNQLPLILIAGPCQIESASHALEMAEALCKLTKKLGINFIYKSSFDKANRTSIECKRGIGLDKAIPIFAEIKERFSCPILTDVHNEQQCSIISTVVDIIQIPALLCRQTDLLNAAAKTGKIINIKKGQFLAPWDIINIIAKMDGFNNKNILITERGTSFGYNNLVSDMRAIPIISDTGVPVIFDATHSVQQPGGLGQSSGGQRRFVTTLAKAAVASQVAGIFLETHENPDNAPSDGPCMIKFQDLSSLLESLIEFDQLAKKPALNLE